MITEREKLEFESLPEFVREPRPSRESYVTKQSSPVTKQPVPVAKPSAPVAKQSAPVTKPAAVPSKPATAITRPAPAPSKTTMELADEPELDAHLPKSAELEALWPGVNHDVFHAAPRKGPSFYLTVGFVAGAVVALTTVWGVSTVSHLASNQQGKEIVVKQQSTGHGGTAGMPGAPGEPAAILPLTASYTVGDGDTLAGIALKNYHRATPRLLDEICKANNMTNANVLSLGQKLVLPEYHPTRQIATGANQAQQ